MGEPIHVISLGAGVQSSTMALMAAHGEIGPMPSYAVFADTKDESQATYKWLVDLEKMLPFPIFNTTRGRLSDRLTYRNFSQIPCFKDGSIGLRQCTREYKIRPIRREIRKQGGKEVILWLGISIDEVSRMKPSGLQWLVYRFPMIEERMSRKDCLTWMERKGFPLPPKSSCLYCPYKSDSQWKALKDAGGQEWDFVVSIDGQLNARGEFLHSSCRPINEIEFPAEEPDRQLNLFENECEGMCGV